MSTQFLAQPFVWRDWPPGDVLTGWLHIALDRLLVASPVAACVALADRWRPRSIGQRVALLAGAVVAGAVLGEALRIRLDPFSDLADPLAIAGRVVQWAAISAAAAGMVACWRLHADNATAAAAAGAADARARQMLTASRLDALQRQIEPHFLFNTLATVRRFGQTAPAEGGALLERLFDYVSAIFAASPDRQSVLGAELDLVMAYLDVCAVRMGPRLKVVDAIDPALRGRPFPPLMLGTLVENAMRHGLAASPAGGTITLSAQCGGAWLEVSVTDDGMGLTGEGGAGIGLANLAARLRLLHGRDASLRLEAVQPHGVRATLRLPHALAA